MVLASHIIVSFACSSFDGIADLARKHLESVSSDPYSGTDDARAFLTDASLRSGVPLGPKGGMFLWGWTGNHVDASGFVNTLRPFFRELLSGEIEGGPCEHELVIVLTEQEQSWGAVAIEISKGADLGLRVVRHELPFSWGIQ